MHLSQTLRSDVIHTYRVVPVFAEMIVSQALLLLWLSPQGQRSSKRSVILQDVLCCMRSSCMMWCPARTGFSLSSVFTA